MKTFTRILLIALGVLIFTACGPTMTTIPPVFMGNNPYAVQGGDGDLLRPLRENTSRTFGGEVRIDSYSLNVAESMPPQVFLNFAYFQPTPCFQLRVEVNQPDAQNRIKLRAYSVAEKGKPCVLMALATPLQANLSLGSFPKGHYSVWLNGVSVGEFDS